LVSGNLGPQGMSPTTRIVLFNFWEYVAFLANSLVFLLIGLQVNIPSLVANWQPVLLAILAVLAARAIVTYGLGWLGNQVTEPIPWRWLHVLNWGGLRGAIALALALSLPEALSAERDLVRVMAFGVVLFTLVVQSMTMKPLLRWLGIAVRDPLQIEYEMRHARMLAFRAAALHLDRMQREGFLSEHAWEVLRPELLARVDRLALDVRALQGAHPELAAKELDTARRELLRAQRSALRALQREGAISEEVFENLVAEIDAGLDAGLDGYKAPAAPGEQEAAEA